MGAPLKDAHGPPQESRGDLPKAALVLFREALVPGSYRLRTDGCCRHSSDTPDTQGEPPPSSDDLASSRGFNYPTALKVAQYLCGARRGRPSVPSRYFSVTDLTHSAIVAKQRRRHRRHGESAPTESKSAQSPKSCIAIKTSGEEERVFARVKGSATRRNHNDCKSRPRQRPCQSPR